MDDDAKTKEEWVPGESPTARVHSPGSEPAPAAAAGPEDDLPGANADVGLGDPNEGRMEPAPAGPPPVPAESTQTESTRLYVVLEGVDLAELVADEVGGSVELSSDLFDSLRGVEVYVIRGQADAHNHELAVRKVAKGMDAGERLLYPVPLSRWRPTPATTEVESRVSLG